MATALTQKPATTPQVQWGQDNLPTISFEEGYLRPTNATDKPFYRSLFTDPITMRLYLGGAKTAENTDARVDTYIAKWKEHHFSAFVVINQQEEKIAHVILGHGDYEGNFENGWSMGGIIVARSHWNADKNEGNSGSGTAGKTHIATSIAKSMIAYARVLKERNELVPCDVNSDKEREEIEQALQQGKQLKVHRDAEGKINWIYLPFKEIRATAHKENIASLGMLRAAGAGEVGFEEKDDTDPARKLFILKV